LPSRIAAALITLFSTSLTMTPVRAQEPKTTVREVATLAGTVERIDRISRALTLRTDHNATQTVYVDPAVKLFDELKTGDKVSVRVRESVIVAVRPDLKPSVPVDTTAAAKKRDAAGQAEVLHQINTVVTIERVDPQLRTVLYRTADNRRIVRAVIDARLLEGLKPGDVVEITYTRERAIELQRQR
jgi:hypothetical protein